MSKPHIHAQSSAKKYGGTPEDYMDIHEFLDSSKAAIADNRHRALTHTSWFVSTILPRVFGNTFVNSEDRIVHVRDIGEQHVLEDFGGKFIPTPQDWFQALPFDTWMNNGAGTPPSMRAVFARGTKTPFKGD